MNWEQILTDIILSLAGVLFSALGIVVTYLVNKFVKDQKAKDIVNSLNNLVRNSVLEIYQVFVQELKEKGLFNREAQGRAREACLNLIKTNMSNEVKEWLEANYSDITGYLTGLIEAQIGALKNSGGK